MPEENEKWLHSRTFSLLKSGIRGWWPRVTLLPLILILAQLPPVTETKNILASNRFHASQIVPSRSINVITNSQYKFHFPVKGYLRICKSVSLGLLHYGSDHRRGGCALTSVGRYFTSIDESIQFCRRPHLVDARAGRAAYARCLWNKPRFATYFRPPLSDHLVTDKRSRGGALIFVRGDEQRTRC